MLWKNLGVGTLVVGAVDERLVLRYTVHRYAWHLSAPRLWRTALYTSVAIVVNLLSATLYV